MSTSTTNTQFPAFGNGDLAVVRVEGPGVCRESGRFETLLGELERRGFSTLVLDFTACPRVDSTFAGVLLRLARRVQVSPAGPSRLRVALTGVCGTVAELLETLCVRDFLDSVNLPDLSALSALSIPDQDLSKEKILEISLDGHERLASLNEANARRFAALLPMLRAELERIRANGKTPPPPPDASAGAAPPCPELDQD